QGTFFYAVGFNAVGADRVGFVRLPKPHAAKMKNPRDDDDPDDGWTENAPAGWHVSDNGDADADGLPDAYDTSNYESVQGGDDLTLQPGQTVTYPMSASSNSLALVAVATASDPLALLRVDIYNASGALM